MFENNGCPWKTYEWWFSHHLWQKTSTTCTVEPMLPISTWSNTGYPQTGQNVTFWGKRGSRKPPPKLQKSKCVEVTFNKHWGSKISHHHFPYAVNYIKYRLYNAYTTPYSSCLECPLTSQDFFSSPVPVNYTKWCVRHWFYESTVVASNPIITCLLVQ